MKKAVCEDAQKSRSRPSFLLPSNILLMDNEGEEWRLGASMGLGGCGEIYSAQKWGCDSDSEDYVVKIEPVGSGPLYTERHVYMRLGKEEHIRAWMAGRRGGHCGMPLFVSHGRHREGDKAYEFIVLPKFGVDAHTVFLNNGNRFDFKTAFTLATYTIDALEYLHDNGYAHADVKGANLVLTKENKVPVHLIDYGLACKFYDEGGFHKKMKYDERRAHDGTLEYTSRDAHCGAHSRRGDMESLAYNLMHWLSGKLPWEDCLDDADAVAEEKWKLISEIPKRLQEWFAKTKSPLPKALVSYFEYVENLGFKIRPDYDYCKRLFKGGVRESGMTFDGDISLKYVPVDSIGKKFRRNSDRENVRSLKKRFHSPGDRSPCGLRNAHLDEPVAPQKKNGRLTRNTPHTPLQIDWPKLLAGNPEKSNGNEFVTPERFSRVSEGSSNGSDTFNLTCTWELENPTPQMALYWNNLEDEVEAINKYKENKIRLKKRALPLEMCRLLRQYSPSTSLPLCATPKKVSKLSSEKRREKRESAAAAAVVTNNNNDNNNKPPCAANARKNTFKKMEGKQRRISEAEPEENFSRLTRNKQQRTFDFNWPAILAGHPEKLTTSARMYRAANTTVVVKGNDNKTNDESISVKKEVETKNRVADSSIEAEPEVECKLRRSSRLVKK